MMTYVFLLMESRTEDIFVPCIANSTLMKSNTLMIYNTLMQNNILTTNYTLMTNNTLLTNNKLMTNTLMTYFFNMSVNYLSSMSQLNTLMHQPIIH